MPPNTHTHREREKAFASGAAAVRIHVRVRTQAHRGGGCAAARRLEAGARDPPGRSVQAHGFCRQPGAGAVRGAHGAGTWQARCWLMGASILRTCSLTYFVRSCKIQIDVARPTWLPDRLLVAAKSCIHLARIPEGPARMAHPTLQQGSAASSALQGPKDEQGSAQRSAACGPAAPGARTAHVGVPQGHRGRPRPDLCACPPIAATPRAALAVQLCTAGPWHLSAASA